jgi:hypothetical protein
VRTVARTLPLGDAERSVFVDDARSTFGDAERSAFGDDARAARAGVSSRGFAVVPRAVGLA